MGKTKHQGPGTAGPYGKKKRGDRDMQNFPVKIEDKWVVKGPPPDNEQPEKKRA